jgi:hypothetical protein
MNTKPNGTKKVTNKLVWNLLRGKFLITHFVLICPSAPAIQLLKRNLYCPKSQNLFIYTVSLGMLQYVVDQRSNNGIEWPSNGLLSINSTTIYFDDVF